MTQNEAAFVRGLSTLTGKEIEIDIEPTDKVMRGQYLFMPISLYVHLFGYAGELGLYPLMLSA
ncbi:hypothetical protein MC885_010504 [Smutsia gigantea]|nr:hypothetical protein MC885_010504 [Smutsia gigantea]